MTTSISHYAACLFAVAGLLSSNLASAEVDAEAAKALFKQNDCTKCHAPVKDKKGPSLKKIAKENAGKADAVRKLVEHMTSGKKVKLEDGTEEEHKIIDTKDKKTLQNMAEWILSN